MRIALGKIRSIAGDIPTNINRHLDWIERGARNGADAIFFPELSLSGYEPTLAATLALTSEDPVLEPLQAIANRRNILIGVGAPLKSDLGIHIAMLIFRPQQPVDTYAKQWLHTDEEPFFQPGNRPHLIQWQGCNISPAICYESLRPAHLQQSLRFDPDVYLASVAKPQQGLDQASQYFPAVAREHQLHVLMVNSFGPADNFLAVGQSSAWDDRGQLTGSLSENTSGLLMYEW